MQPPTRYWSVPREWPGETVFILAGGPSLRDFDAEVLRGAGRIITINNSYLLCPWADVLYGCDASWWRTHATRIAETFHGKYRISIGTSENGVLRLRHGGLRGLNTDPTALAHGTNSGFQAINLAANFGAARIILLGYDMHCKGGTHWHPGHGAYDADSARFERKLQNDMLPEFQSLVEPLRSRGVEVINSTPNSALKCWPYLPLEEVLETCPRSLIPVVQE